MNKKDVIQARNIHGERTIFSPHNTLKLYPMDEKHLKNLVANCDRLHMIAKKYVNEKCFERVFAINVGTFFFFRVLPFKDTVKCLLCAKELFDLPLLEVHLVSRLHKERENQIGVAQLK